MADARKPKIETLARIKRIACYICLTLAVANATLAVEAMVDEKNWHSGRGGIAMAAMLFALGIVNLTRPRRRPPPDA